MRKGTEDRKGWTIPVAEGIELYAEAHGDGAATVIAPLAAWLSPVLAPLARDHTLVLYDMRGRGRSTPVDDPELLGLDLDVADLEAVRRYLDVPEAAVVGFSYLGAVAALYAARHPDRISRLVQIGPVPPRSGAPYASPEESAAALREEAAARLGRFREEGLTERDPRGYCRAFWEAYAPLYVANEEAMPVFLRQAEATCQWPNERPVAFLRTLEGVLGSLDAYDWRPLASEILAPTLVIHGREDKAAPVEGGREWAAANPNARFVPLERAGHFVWIDRPDDTLDLIRTFLAEPERGAPPPDATSGAAERGGPG